MNVRKCKLCKEKLLGRSDKVFCSAKCKANYHNKLKTVTLEATQKTDKILHRNRSILLELMGKNIKQKQIPIEKLINKNFKFDYCTGIYENAKGKRYTIVYDFAWMKFSNGNVLIIRRGSND